MKDNPAPELISRTLINLLHEREYADISMGDIAEAAFIGRRTCYRYFSTKDDILRHIVKGLMKKLTDTIIAAQKEYGTELGLHGVTLSYFRFWEENFDILSTFRKAKLMHFIADDFENIILNVAAAVKYNNMPLTKELLEAAKKDERYYVFLFDVAGYWRLTIHWCECEPRKTPEEMADLISKIIR